MTRSNSTKRTTIATFRPRRRRASLMTCCGHDQIDRGARAPSRERRLVRHEIPLRAALILAARHNLPPAVEVYDEAPSAQEAAADRCDDALGPAAGGFGVSDPDALANLYWGI